MKYQRLPLRVRAELLTAEWEWASARGERLIAQPGDYRLSDPVTRSRWSVTSEALSESYRAVGDGEYESRGDVDARQIEVDAEPELVVSREGPELAQPGDWVLTGSLNGQWVVENEWFIARYSKHALEPSAQGKTMDSNGGSD